MMVNRDIDEWFIQSLSIGGEPSQTEKKAVVDPVNFPKINSDGLELNAQSSITGDCKAVLADHGD